MLATATEVSPKVTQLRALMQAQAAAIEKVKEERKAKAKEETKKQEDDEVSV